VWLVQLHTHSQAVDLEGKRGEGGAMKLCIHIPPAPCRSAFTVAVVGSAVVVRYQVTQRRKQQEARGSRPSEKLSWEERVVIEEQNTTTGTSIQHLTTKMLQLKE